MVLREYLCPHHCGDNFFSQSNINFDKAGKAEQEKRFMNQCCSIWFDEDIHECFMKRSQRLYEGFIKSCLLPLQELKEINSGSFFVQTATSQQQDKETKKIKRKKRVFRQRTNKDSKAETPTNQQ